MRCRGVVLGVLNLFREAGWEKGRREKGFNECIVFMMIMYCFMALEMRDDC